MSDTDVPTPTQFSVAVVSLVFNGLANKPKTLTVLQ